MTIVHPYILKIIKIGPTHCVGKQKKISVLILINQKQNFAWVSITMAMQFISVLIKHRLLNLKELIIYPLAV